MRVHKIYHWSPPQFKGIVLLPIGMYYNRHLQNMTSGDLIQFQNEDKPHRVIRVAELDLNSQIASLLAFYLYKTGKRIMISHWRYTAVMEGYNKHAVSVNKCLAVHYKEEMEI